MGAIPVNRLLQTLFKWHLGRPSQCTESAAIDRIPAIMSRPILNESDQIARSTQRRQDVIRHRHVLAFIPAPDVINGPRLSMTEHMLDTGHMIMN